MVNFASRYVCVTALCAVIATFFAGCSQPRVRTSFEVPRDRADATFDAAIAVLREQRLTPERIDAQQGIITTAQKRTAGLASLWDPEQSSLADEVEDTLHFQTRWVRIQLAKASTPENLTDESRMLFEANAPVTCEVEAFITRRQAPLVRPQTRVLGLTNQAFDPALAQRGMQGTYSVALATDDEYAAWLAGLIRSRASASRK